MKIGVPKEIKNHEYRVGLTPASVRELTSRGHEVLVQTGAGASIGLTDEEYVAAGAKIAADAASIFATAEMIVKVKEPQPQECAMLRPGQILYTYLHLAPDPEQTAALIKSGAICIAYETITGANGGLPLLAPMSEVAGRMAVQAGAAHLEKSKGGMGILLGGVPGGVGGNLAGVVMNNVDITSDHQYQYYTTYYSYYSADGASSGENADASSMKKVERSGKAKELAATQSHDSEDLY